MAEPEDINNGLSSLVWKGVLDKKKLKYKNRRCFWLPQFPLQLDDFVSTTCKAVQRIGTRFSFIFEKMKLTLVESLWNGWTAEWFRGRSCHRRVACFGVCAATWNQRVPGEKLEGEILPPWYFQQWKHRWHRFFLVKFLFLLKCFCLTS